MNKSQASSPERRVPLYAMHEECGVCGVFGHSEASRLVYLGLQALQHRGQESAGIWSSDGKRAHHHVSMGLVADAFTRDDLDSLKGRLAIGHVRYSTAGSSSLKNAQPLSATTHCGAISVAHNGNLVNADFLRKKLERAGSIFQGTSDSEVILHLLARHPQGQMEQAIIDSLQEVKGAFSLLIATKETIYAVRDPYGVRPLALGTLGSAKVVASETSAFDLLGVKYLRDVEPGEMVVISKSGFRSRRILFSAREAKCVFEFVYFSRPDSRIFGKSVYEVRRELGRQLARECKVKADVVVPVPDSATAAAVGYAEEAGIPYEMGFIRSHYIGRTFIEPKQSIRDFGAKIKYNVVREAVYGKRVVIVDDSIVRGTTSRKLVRMLKGAGASEIHFRVSSPPIVGPCFYGIDTPTTKELIASHTSIPAIRDYLGVDSLYYLSVEGMLKATKMDARGFCTACFTGHYPIGTPEEHK